MKRFAVLIGVLTIFVFLFPFSIGHGSSNVIKVNSDLQMLEYPAVYGGHITWHISGEIAKELREAVAQEYHVKAIDLATASHYFKNKLEKVIENNKYECGYLAFVRLYRADPLHNDTNGILNDAGDVEGLIGEVNSTSPITLKMLVRGDPVENRNFPIIPTNLSYAPFLALVDNYSQLFVKFPSLKSAHLQSGHYEILAGLGNIENLPPGVTSCRLIVGEFFMTGNQNQVVKYSRFDPLESPLLLFILFIVASYSFRKIESYLASKNSETLGPIERKNARRVILGERIALLFLYFVYLFSGLIYIIVLLASVIATLLFIRWYYGRVGRIQPMLQSE